MTISKKTLYILFLFLAVVRITIANNVPYVSLDLSDAEKLGIENSPQIKVIGYQQQVKNLLVTENWRNYFPTVTVRWDRNSNIIQSADDTRNNRLSVNVDQVVYDGGRRALSLLTVLSDVALQKYDLRLALNDLRFKIRTSYFNLLSRKAQMKVYEFSKKRQNEQLYFATNELRLGETTEVQTLEVENRLNEIIVLEKNSQIAYSNQMEDFKILLRLPSDTQVDLKGDILKTVNLKFEEMEELELIEYAYKYRVEFDRAKAQEMQTSAQHEYAKAYWIPNVSIGGFSALRDQDYPPRQQEWGVNFKVSMLLGANTFSDTGNYTSRNDDTDKSYNSSTAMSFVDQLPYKRQIVSSGIAAYQAKLSRKQLDDIIKNEVKKALANYKASWAAMKQAEGNVTLFEKRIKIKEQQVRLGEARRTELAENEIRYLEAKNAEIAAIVRYMTSISELELSTGLSLDSLKLLEIQ